MQHIPEGVIQAPESPDAPEALPGCRSISDDDLCRLSTGNGIRPSVYGCPEFQPNIIHP